MLDEKIGVGHPAADIVVLITAHHEKIGQWQDSDRDTDIGKAASQSRDFGRRHRRKFGHMTDDDPPTATVFLRQFANEVDVHRLGGVADIEVNVDIDVELSRELENAPDLTCMVGVVTRGAADARAPRFSASTNNSSMPG